MLHSRKNQVLKQKNCLQKQGEKEKFKRDLTNLSKKQKEIDNSPDVFITIGQNQKFI